MSLHKYVKVGYFDFKKSDKIYQVFPKHYEHDVRFYDFDIVCYHYDTPYIKGRGRCKSGFLILTFVLACTQKVNNFFTDEKDHVRYNIFQRGPHDLKTAVWRKTYNSEISYDPDYDEPDSSPYKKLMRRIKLNEFS